MNKINLGIKKLVARILIAILQILYRNRPYKEFYAVAMRVRSWVSPQFAIGGRWDEIGDLQFNYLVSRGLRPEHRLLDFGCGALRGGLRYINYLDTGNYEGLDISAEALKFGSHYVEEAKLTCKQPRLHLSSGLTLDELEGRTFDFIIAQSVLTHMPLEDITELMRNISKAMRPDTEFCATYFDGGDRRYTTQSRLNFYFPAEELVQLAGSFGLTARVDETFQHPRGQSMLIIRRKPEIL